MLHKMAGQNGKSHLKEFCALLNKSNILVTIAKKEYSALVIDLSH